MPPKIWQPESLASALEQALADLKLVEKDERYIVNMSLYHVPIKSNKCEVCLAGAVLAKTCKVPIDSFILLNDRPDKHVLRAMNYLRQGRIDLAYHQFYGEFPNKMKNDWDVTLYQSNPTQFHKDMEALLVHLKETGI